MILGNQRLFLRRRSLFLVPRSLPHENDRGSFDGRRAQDEIERSLEFIETEMMSKCRSIDE
jgi:hypothetical protein